MIWLRNSSPVELLFLFAIPCRPLGVVVKTERVFKTYGHSNYNTAAEKTMTIHMRGLKFVLHSRTEVALKKSLPVFGSVKQ